MRGIVSTAIVAMSVLSASSCSPGNTAATTQPEPKPASTRVAMAPTITLPVSINAVMVALVDHASEPLWLDAYEPPKTADRWLEAEYNAYQMVVSGKLIQLPGTGPNDAGWVEQPEWKNYADAMSAAGMDALTAAKARDVAALNAAGDRLVASCESCHKAFKPGLTSMGIYKSPNYPPK
jgi:hypothetical protein